MRRTPYTQRSYRHSHLNFNPNPSSPYNHTPVKSDLNIRQTPYINYYVQTKNIKPYLITTRTSQSHAKRSFSGNQFYSPIKHKNQEREDQVPNKDLWVSTVKDPKLKLASRDGEHSKGKLFRGSSWKPEEKGKQKIPSFRDEVDFRTSAKTTRYFQNLTPGPRQDRYYPRQNNNRNSGVYDLLGKNAKKKQTKHIPKEENFFQYVMRFSYRTKKGVVPSNPGKVNQDTYIISPNINKKTWQHFFAVCDGHGPLGHFVSGYIKETLPHYIAHAKNMDQNPTEALMKAFQHTYQKMIKQSHIDMSFSGSTIIGCYMCQNKLFTCNVGDSRAIIGSCDNGKWSAIPLSEDHKPNLPKEAERIKKMNGRIEAYTDEYGQGIGPLRVWIQNDSVPGLAMTRSFGDLVGASVGVSPVPEIKSYSLSQKDRIILIASDGVFEFLENDEIIESLIKFYEKNQIQQASDHLLNMAHESWTDNSSIVDDITFILIFINYNEI